MTAVLFVGLNKQETKTLGRYFESVGLPWAESQSIERVVTEVEYQYPPVIFVKEPGDVMAIQTLAEKAQSISPPSSVVVVLERPRMDDAVEFMRAGAFDCVSKPFNRLDILATAKRAGDRVGRRLAIPKLKVVPRRSLRAAAIFACVCLGTLLGVRQMFGPPKDILEMDSKFLSGLQWTDRNLLVGDWFNATVSRFKVGWGPFRGVRKLKTDRLYRMKSGQPILVCETEDSLVTVGTDLMLRTHKWDVGLPTVQTLPLQVQTPTGLGWDGKSVWMSDRETGRLFRYDRFFQVLETIPSLIQNPVGMTAEPEGLWVLGGKPLKVARLQKRARGYIWEGPYHLGEWIPQDKTITGMAVGFGRLWVSMDGESAVVSKDLEEIAKKGLVWTEGEDTTKDKSEVEG